MARHGGTIPGKSTPFTPSSILFRPHDPRIGWCRSLGNLVEPPGTAPGSERFITTPVYRHSRPLRDGTPNIGARGLRSQTSAPPPKPMGRRRMFHVKHIPIRGLYPRRACDEALPNAGERHREPRRTGADFAAKPARMALVSCRTVRMREQRAAPCGGA